MIHCVDCDPYILYCLPYIFTREMTPNEYLTRDNIIIPRVRGGIVITKIKDKAMVCQDIMVIWDNPCYRLHFFHGLDHCSKGDQYQSKFNES